MSQRRDHKPDRRRTLHSFVRREGRLTSGQQNAIDNFLPVWGIPDDGGVLDLIKLFGNQQPVVLEIGFGNGESLLQNALDHPDQNYLGVEVHRPGVGHLLMRMQQHETSNIRVSEMDAVELLNARLAAACLLGVQIFFPDPWPKKRHHKRRLIQGPFLDQLRRVLQPQGWLHMATDWQNYAAHMLRVTDAHPGFSNQSGQGCYSARPAGRPVTKFERRGQRLGHQVYDLIYNVTNNNGRGVAAKRQ